MRLAYLSSDVTLPGSPNRRSDAFEHDYMMEALRAGIKDVAGSDAEWIDIAWDDRQANWADFDAAMIGTAWDYWDRQAEFLETLERISDATRLYNSPEIVRWNSHKGYLRDLGQKGARLIPTVWMDHPDAMSVDGAFDVLETEKLVLKRQVGAGADGQHLVARGEALPDLQHAMMAQPFLPAILAEGELSFVFIGGAFSHALVKRAAHGDYRIQSTYGGTEEAVTPRPEDLAAATAVLGYLEETPLYGRVDMLRAPDGGLLLMELELIEPYLYPHQGPELGRRVAEALIAGIEERLSR
ncbi:MAG: hypothetical protein AAFY34_11460 [Pseudomonadota bacterium]